MSHHPTTAELAAFRRDEARITFGTLDPNEYDPSTLAYRVLDSVTRSLYPGAWPDERRDGIGLGPEPWDGAEDRWGSNVRREASALRSRAWARMVERYGMYTRPEAYPSERENGTPNVATCTMAGYAPYR